MSFERVLRSMLGSVPGSVAAMFLDYDGEAVEIAGDRHALDDLKITGAYQGIFMTQLQRVCGDLSLGQAIQFKIDFEHLRILTTALRDGYYLVLVMQPRANEGVAWRGLEVCRETLLREI